MNRIKEFYGKNKKIIKAILITLIILLTTYVIVKEVRGLDARELLRMARTMTFWQKFMFIALGLLCFSFAAIYDFILAAYYRMKMPKLEVFRIGWISQSFNNFIGFGGVAGLTIREFSYNKFDVDRKVVNRIMFIVLFSDIIGLFSLALPSSIGLIKIGKPTLIPLMVLMFAVVLLFIFSDKLPIKKYVTDEDSIFAKGQLKLRVLLTLQSTFEWFLAALFFAFTIKFYQPEISLMESCIVYVLATIVGIISMIPGGLGSFEVACMVLFKMMGYGEPNIVFSLLICRICYTIIPWLVGLILLMISPKDESGEQVFEKANFMSLLLSFSVLMTGVIIILSVAMPRLFIKIRVMGRLFPDYMIMFNRRFTLVIGILLVVLSNGIKNMVKVAHNLSVMLLTIAAIIYLSKGRSYIEAVICIVIAMALLLNRRYFQASTGRLNKSHLIKNSVFVFLIFITYIIFFNITHKVDFLNGTGKYSLDFIKNYPIYVLFSPLVAILVLAVMAGINRKHVEFKKNTDEGMEIFNKFYEKYPYTPYTHLFYMDDKNYFLNEKGTVMFLYRPYKDNILVLGDPAGEPDDFEDAIDELIEWAYGNKMKVCFYQITGKYLEDYMSIGFRFLKIGESATVDVQNFNLAGKRNKVLRKTINSMETKGLSFKVIEPPYDNKTMEELKAVSDEWLGKREEMHFSLGAFEESYLNRAPIFVIENEVGEIEAFANMMPIKGSKVLSIDLMRHKNDAPDGIMDMLFITIIEWAKENGYEYFDLGIAPLSNVGNKRYSSTKEKLVNLAYEYGNKIYGFKGLRKYKNKFNPEWSSVFIAYKDDLSLPETLLALVNVCYGRDTIKDLDYYEELRKKAIN
ncbi:bifunctional lysylphosphatidylglycerol flippase/synthetase MprF [Miniphocaeibacter halophilus]|uniref:Bifunctional lysylphosphatidylglycerol flippase/synthetase MprF n=1 Tax=Miniphocaeibacter halophilus TaxID=2931922 RepID=A0AC61MRE9_9FIRM|nr:bifunctional lysylphosphatidylglycerol flippase/synthetase MprF [Miniphocaeibacter halophilus]QQK08121.1 bifunctional lysylphosphatidylglycerol flippase/synthetase MprF [Miniphocaeibacter halophilus]